MFTCGLPIDNSDAIGAQGCSLPHLSRGYMWMQRCDSFCLGPSRSQRTSLVAQTVKRLSTMRETRVQALGREDPLEKEMAIHSSTVAWKIPWTEEPGKLQSMGSQRIGHD